MSFDLEKTISLLAEAKAGNREATEELFRRYLPRLRQSVQFRMGKPIHRLAEASDIVQDTLFNAVEKIDLFEWRSDAAFLNWLSKIALNKIREEARVAKRTLPTVEDLDITVTLFPAGCPSPLSDVGRIERAEIVQEAILNLVPSYRDMIDKRDNLKMSYAEIAAELEHSQENCRKLHQRARQALREALERRGMGESDAK